MTTVRVTVDTRGLENWVKSAGEAAKNAVRVNAFRMQASSMLRPRMPIDTGALKNSMNARQDESNPLIWRVTDGVLYGVFQELGTSRGVPARHFLGNAAEVTAPKFFKDIKTVMEKGRS